MLRVHHVLPRLIIVHHGYRGMKDSDNQLQKCWDTPTKKRPFLLQIAPGHRSVRYNTENSRRSEGVGEERRKEEELGRYEKGFISPILLLRFGAVLPAPVVPVKPQTVSLRENKVIHSWYHVTVLPTESKVESNNLQRGEPTGKLCSLV